MGKSRYKTLLIYTLAQFTISLLAAVFASSFTPFCPQDGRGFCFDLQTLFEDIPSTIILVSLLILALISLTMIVYLLIWRPRDAIACQAVEQEFEFSIADEKYGRKIPQCRKTREAFFRAFKTLPEYLERILYIHDPSQIPDDGLIEFMDLKSEFCFERADKRSEYKTAMESDVSKSNLRAVRIRQKIADVDQNVNNFSVRDEMMLPNDFTNDREYWFLSIHDNLDYHKVKFLFMDIEVESAYYEIYRYGRLAQTGDIEIHRSVTKNGPERKDCHFEQVWENLKPGTRIEIWWEWDLNVPPDEDAHARPVIGSGHSVHN